MSRILIVDDEEVYRRQLELTLHSDGHEIQTASSAREAIDIGSRFRPEILVTDWMLKDHVHGLHVAQVLHAVHGDVRTILITGFASDDLKEEAKEVRVFDFVEKPIDRERILSAVSTAISSQPINQSEPRLGVIEIESSGEVSFANDRAQELLDETTAGRTATNLSELFSPENIPDLKAASEHWVVVTPKTDEPITWHIRTQDPGENRNHLVVLRRQDEPLYTTSGLVEMLLGFEDNEQVRWPFPGRVLILDDEALIRRCFSSMLENAGAGCYAVGSPNEAIKFLKKDDGISHIIHDFDLPGADPAESVRTIRESRPDVVIVGTSGIDHRPDFKSWGVDYFLQKPWRVDSLISVLVGRLGNCVECGLPIPLRKPKEGEQAQSWECCGCGSRYRAVFDETCSLDAKRHVRSAD